MILSEAFMMTWHAQYILSISHLIILWRHSIFITVIWFPHVAKSESLKCIVISTISSSFKDVICASIYGLYHVALCNLLNEEWHLYLSQPSTAHICKNSILWSMFVLQDELWVGYHSSLWNVSQTILCHHAKKNFIFGCHLHCRKLCYQIILWMSCWINCL